MGLTLERFISHTSEEFRQWEGLTFERFNSHLSGASLSALEKRSLTCALLFISHKSEDLRQFKNNTILLMKINTPLAQVLERWKSAD